MLLFRYWKWKVFRKLIPELLAIALKFGMKPNTYYEELEYRVFYHAENKTFINIDMMTRFEAPDIPPSDCQRVTFFFLIFLSLENHWKKRSNILFE